MPTGEDITSRPYPAELDMACERCVFGTGAHRRFCVKHPYNVKTMEPLSAIVYPSGGGSREPWTWSSEPFEP